MKQESKKYPISTFADFGDTPIMKKIYIASPVRPVLEYHDKDKAFATSLIRDYALRGCRDIKKLNHLPISPILSFDGIYDEFSERDRIDEACKTLLLSCDYIYIVHTPHNDESKGIRREMEIAIEYGIPRMFRNGCAKYYKEMFDETN